MALKDQLKELEKRLEALNKQQHPNTADQLRNQISRLKEQIAAQEGGGGGDGGDGIGPGDVGNPETPAGTGGGGTGPPGEGVAPPADEDDEDEPTEAEKEAEAKAQADLLADFGRFLEEWGLPSTLLPQIQGWITAEVSPTEINARILKTPEYLSLYPEGELRRQAGLSWWSAAQIREYRDAARAAARFQLGITDLTDAEIARLIVTDVSVPEWEGRLQTWQNFKRWGPTVRAVLEAELGLTIPDDRVFAFMSPDIATPELDRAYETALLRGQPALLGLGIRPEEEAELLRRYGISPEQAFRGYQGIVEELPAQERFSFIESEIERNAGQFPSGDQLFNDTPFALLFRGIQLQEGDAIRELQARLAREVARFQAGGGAQSEGTALTGLTGTVR